MKLKVPYGLFGLLLSASGAFAAEIPDYPFVFVVGKADTETPPNIATCSLTLRAREQDPDKAASIIEDRLKSVLTALRANHVASGDIESFNIQKQVLTNENDYNDRTTIKGYEVDPDVLRGDDLLVPSTIHISVSVNALFKME